MGTITEFSTVNWEENPELISKKVSLIIRKMNRPRRRNDVKRNLVEDLTKSNAELEEKICAVMMRNFNKKENEHFQSINHLVKTMEMLDHHLHTEKKYLNDLERQIDKVTQKPIALNRESVRSKPATHDISGNKATVVDKRKEIMQHRLHVENVHLSKELLKNAELREKINCLMNERKNFNKEYDNLLGKLKHGKTVLEDLTRSVNTAFMVRNNLVKKMEKIKLNENKQKKLQTEEAQDLEFCLSQETDLINFYFDKLKERAGSHNVLALRKKSLELENETNYKKLDGYLKMANNTALMCMSNDTDFIDEKGVVQCITKRNQEVMSLISYEMQLNYEVEAMKEKVLDQEKQITEKTLERDEKNLLHWRQVEDLSIDLNKLQELKYETHETVEHHKKIFNRLLNGIENLTNLIKCDVSPLLLLLGENNKVTHNNYNFFLHILQTKMNAMMNMLEPPEVSLLSQNTSVKLRSGVKYHSVIITENCPECFSRKISDKLSIWSPVSSSRLSPLH